jgi:DNA-binding NarL/FixJ family response regulator
MDSGKRSQPLTQAEWTVVHRYEREGRRYIVACESPPRAGLAVLTERERQVVTCLALGKSTKETAYELGISDVTVRVVVRRAAAKLGVLSRAALLEHADVRSLRAR